METESGWQQGAGATAPTGAASSVPTPLTKYQSPEVTSTRKRLTTNRRPLPLPGGFVPGMGEGCWKVDLVLSPSTHHRPQSVPRLRVWRWERRECFRRLTHHIQAQSHLPSWAPDGHAGLRSWWARWLAHASCPWWFRHWSPRFHRPPRKRRTERQRGQKRREAEKRVKTAGEEGGRGKLGVETMTVEERMQGTHEERWEVESSKRHSDGGGADERLLHIIFIYIYIYTTCSST